MKIQIKKTVSIVLAIIFLLNLSTISIASNIKEIEKKESNINTVTGTTNIQDNTNNDFIISAKQSTIMGDYNNAFIDVNVKENFHLNSNRKISNVMAYASIEKPLSVHIADRGVYNVSGGSFRIPLYTLDTDENVTIPINITLKYDIETTPEITTSTTIDDSNITVIDKKEGTVTSTKSDINRNDTINKKTYESKEMTTTIYVVHLAKRVLKTQW